MPHLQCRGILQNQIVAAQMRFAERTRYRLSQITDFLGRQLNFQYDSAGHLLAVVTPSILKAVTGNTFPGGTAYVFQYDTENPRPDRQDDLIKIWYPNETLPFLNTQARTVDVAAVYAQAQPRYVVEYGQDITDTNTWGKVVNETVGDPNGGPGGAYRYSYSQITSSGTPFAPSTAVTFNRTTVQDRNNNLTNYDFDDNNCVIRKVVLANRGKNSDEATSWVTWTKYNDQNQPLWVIYPNGNSTEYDYEDGNVSVPGIANPYTPRRGLLIRETAHYDNPSPTSGDFSIPHPALAPTTPEFPQSLAQQSKRYFYDPIFTQRCAVIEERGNPIDGSDTYYTPQNDASGNGGTPPTDTDRSRYATFYTFDYQKDQQPLVSGDATLKAMLGFTTSGTSQIDALITYVNNKMTATDGTGGLPSGFLLNLGDVNGEGTGHTTTNSLPSASHLGNTVMIVHPKVLQLVLNTGSGDPWVWQSQTRTELFTVNLRGQATTATDAEGNITVYVRYPDDDPEGDGQAVSGTLTHKQYGRIREVHRDADPASVMSLVGVDGDLVDFIPQTTRLNTANTYQDLITRFEGATGCATCSYDAMGNVLNQTDARGFTTIFDRNELGEVYRVTAPAPYSFRTETSYDANRNVIQVDTEDKVPLYTSTDPIDPRYGHFSFSGSGTTSHVPMTAGNGGSVRPGWFSNLYTYDLIDNKIEDDVDATGSSPANLVTTYAYDGNQNLIKLTKPEGNTVEYDYDERNLQIAMRVGYDPTVTDHTVPNGAITIWTFDGNGNLLNTVGPVDRGGTKLSTQPTIADAFGSGDSYTPSTDVIVQNTYDGFDRLISSLDAGLNKTLLTYDPTAAVVEKQMEDSSSVLLSKQIMLFDEARRQYEDQRGVFIAAGSTTLPSGRSVVYTGGGLEFNSTTNGNNTPQTLTGTGAVTTAYALTRTVFDRADRVIGAAADNTGFTVYNFDGANRIILITDPLNNTVANQYDGNNNLTQVTRTEVCTITSPSVSNESFITFSRYDALDRVVVTGSQGADGSFTTSLSVPTASSSLPATLFGLFGYDSRGNRVLEIDYKFNTTVNVFDGANRQVETQRQLRQLGDGFNPPAANQTFLTAGKGLIRTEMVYDGNGRLTDLIDDRGHGTSYTYDLLDRQVTMTFADGSIRTSTYDLGNALIGYTDENQSSFAYTVDPLGRRTQTDITAASGVGGTTQQTFTYDGLSRMTQAIDSISGTNAEVDIYYDSLNRVIEEQQIFGGNTRRITHDAWTSWVPTDLMYPNDRHVANSYDILYRRNSINEGSTGGALICSWQFIGAARVVEQAMGTNDGSGNQIICTQMNNTRTHSAVSTSVTNPTWGDVSSNRLGYDGARRMITKRFLVSGIDGDSFAYTNTTALVGFTTSYDRSGNKNYERHIHAERRSHVYQLYANATSTTLAVGMDSADRLLQYQRGTLSSTGGQGNAGGGYADPSINVPNTFEEIDYTLDGLGNWSHARRFKVGDSNFSNDSRQHNSVNQLTRSTLVVPSSGTTVTNLSYDHGDNASDPSPDVQRRGNGNIVNDGTRVYQYDAFNRVIQVSKTPSSPVVIANYTYDALGRRIQKVISNGGVTGGIPDATTVYLYDGAQSIEERNDSEGADDAVLRQFVWGRYIDEAVQMMSYSGDTGTAFYPLQDLLYRTMALVDATGTIVEAYDTDAYGNTLIFSAAGSGGNWWALDATQTYLPTCEYIFTGRQYDPETQIYYYRARYYSPVLGRFLQRDSSENSDSGNLYAYCLDRPVSIVDPSGRDGDDITGDLTAFAVAMLPLLYQAWNDAGTPKMTNMNCSPSNRNTVCKCLQRQGAFNLPSQLGHHAYLWWPGDAVHPRGCGTHGGLNIGDPKYGGGLGPRGTAHCKEVRQPNGQPLTPTQVAGIRKCICKKNKGIFFPYKHDCHWFANHCIKHFGGQVPPGTGHLDY